MLTEVKSFDLAGEQVVDDWIMPQGFELAAALLHVIHAPLMHIISSVCLLSPSLFNDTAVSRRESPRMLPQCFRTQGFVCGLLGKATNQLD